MDARAEKMIRDQVNKMEGKLDKVLLLLGGNELDKEDNGLVGDVKDLIRRIAKLEKLKVKLTGLLIGMAFPAGWGVTEGLGAIGKAISHVIK